MRSKSKRESQGSIDSSEGSNRVTPYELRRPFMVFHDDEKAVEDIRERRQAMQEIDNGRESLMYDTNLSVI